jgi:signal transduction histidine kinase
MTVVQRPLIRAVGLWLALSALAAVEYRIGGASLWGFAAGVVAVGVAIAARSIGSFLSWGVAVALLGGTWALNDGRIGVYQVALIVVASWWVGRGAGGVRMFGAMLGVGAAAVALAAVLTQDGLSVREGLETGGVMFANLVGLVVVPWLLGLRASRAEATYQSALRETRRRERHRVAQEMHDSLGHELSLIALRAGALEVARGLDDRHRASAGALREAAGTATDRLSEIIGLLSIDGRVRPSPRHETLQDLVTRAQDSGMSILLDEGPRPEVVADMPPAGRRAVHRIVQEALTNAGKHAPGAAVTVRLDPGPERLRVVVSNGRPRRGGGRRGSGLGLTGLVERARTAGGTLSAGPTDEGGYVVAAELPLADRRAS